MVLIPVFLILMPVKKSFCVLVCEESRKATFQSLTPKTKAMKENIQLHKKLKSSHVKQKCCKKSKSTIFQKYMTEEDGLMH